jgi:hypothetical protein
LRHGRLMQIFVAFILIVIALFFVIMGHIKLSKDQLVTLAQNAGFSIEDSNTAAAIALAESAGDPHAYDPETAAGNPQGKGSFGLWQINLNRHPEFFNINLYDSQSNANAAFSVFTNAGNSFSPWSTYTSGAYKGYL